MSDHNEEQPVQNQQQGQQPQPQIQGLLTIPTSVNVLVQAVEAGQKNGIYSLKDAATISVALESLKARLDFLRNRFNLDENFYVGDGE